MPREMIHGSVDPYHVEVGWARERDVQVGIETNEGRSLFWLLLGGRLDQLGAAVRQVVANNAHVGADEQVGRLVLDQLDALSGTYTGLWAILDRAGCNALIRQVRKARDAAFGRDE